MPLVTVSMTPPKNSESVILMIDRIRVRGADAFECGPENIWVIYQPLNQGWSSAPGPIVTIDALEGRSPDMKRNLVAVVVESVGAVLSSPSEKVWVHYREMKKEDVWFDR